MHSTGKALVQHWSWAAERGLMNKNTARTFQSACSEVLGVEENWEEVDVRQMDVEKILLQFQNLRAERYKPRSLASYQNRFRQAVKSFLSYLENPAGWQPPGVRTGSRSSRRARIGSSPLQSDDEPRDESQGPTLIDHGYPLRKGSVIARMRLPADLTLVEVQKLGKFMTTLAADFDPQEN